MKKEIYEQIYQIERTHWWYVARREIIFDWLEQLGLDQGSRTILDIGCGTGLNLEYLQSNGINQVLGLDLSWNALDFSRLRNLSYLVCGDGSKPPFADQSCDFILALDLLEHLEFDREGVLEFARLLKPGGKMIILVPAFQFLWGLQDEVGHHYRRYTSTEIMELISQSNLVVDKLSYINTFLFPLIWMGRIVLRVFGNRLQITSENDLTPGLLNSLLLKVFRSERLFLRYLNFPFGVSIFCIAHK